MIFRALLRWWARLLMKQAEEHADNARLKYFRTRKDEDFRDWADTVHWYMQKKTDYEKHR